MKLSCGFIASSLYATASAASNVAHVFTFDSIPSDSLEPATVDPESARLILAQRLGLARFHSLETADEKAIEQINAWGGRRPKLFGAKGAKDEIDSHLLVWVEHVDSVRDLINDTSKYSNSFYISNPPSAPDNFEFVQDIIHQAQSLPRKSDPQQLNYQFAINTEAAFQPVGKVHTYQDHLSIYHLEKGDEERNAKLSSTLNAIIEGAQDAKVKGWGVTVVAMPPSSGKMKRSSALWGTYDKFETRQKMNTEAFLSPQDSEPSSMPASDIPDLEDFPSIQDVSASADNKAPLGILPVCFQTEEACTKQTNNCTGHGSCGLLHKGEKGKDARTKDCYGCTCKPTIIHNGDTGMEDHRKITYWGGPACQKKDISQPFWLFVGTGVILAGLIASGIGLLYSMGSEELPSVIGAGVSGPVRK